MATSERCAVDNNGDEAGNDPVKEIVTGVSIASISTLQNMKHIPALRTKRSTSSLSLLMIIVALISALSTFAQELKYGDLASMKKKSVGYKSYLSQKGTVYKIGDKLTFGVPSQGETFVLIAKGSGFFAMPAGGDVSKLEAEITEIGVEKALAGNYIVAMKLRGSDGAAYRLSALDEALARGEITDGSNTTVPSSAAGLDRVNTPTTSAAQGGSMDRVNDVLPAISDKVLWSLTDATGWMKNSEGQWIEGKNKVQLSVASLGNKDKWDKEFYLPGRDNFTRFEVREVTVEGLQLYVLTKDMMEGRWKNDPVESNWVNERKVKYIVFKKNAATIDERKVDQHSYPCYKSSMFYMGEVPYSANYISDIALQLGRPKDLDLTKQPPKFTDKSETYAKLAVTYKELPDGKNCRFYVENIDRAISEGGTPWKFYPYFKLNFITSAPKDFYYECPKASVAPLVALMTKK